ncbi:hypothetical protein LK533_07730 [Sphingomonas sp. PL-96]|uniref:hypothetical protein n=1 Tax=Sphingomonas sp. PL-96 TaxID=2887201 RepID=UPI001E2F5550|nr:hypothetical protein [Sphingomonas sp. PL-96]MCC2976563.1 hypothetical protein [Sphingomonas sp. PL-96]
MMADGPRVGGLISTLEVRITRVHVRPDLLIDGHENRVEPSNRQPLIMNFQKAYGVANIEAIESCLAEI